MWLSYNKVVRVDPISVWLLSLGEEETVTQKHTRDEHTENKGHNKKSSSTNEVKRS